MPAFNRESYINEAIESILNQTFQDFELVIIDDGSTDNTVDIIKNYEDPRIKFIQHQVNKGVASARNTGYLAAQGEYIVIADSDDINLPTKLEEQVNFLDNHPEFDIVGCHYQHFNSEDDSLVRIESFPDDNDYIRAHALIWNAQAPASMFRKEKIKNEGYFLHNTTYRAAVDSEWFANQPTSIKFTNIPKVLYLYRIHPQQITVRNNASSIKTFYQNLRVELLNQLGIFPNDTQQKFQYLLANNYDEKIEDIEELQQWLEQILYANKIMKKYNQRILKQILLERYIRICSFNGYNPLSFEKYKDDINTLLKTSFSVFKTNNELLQLFSEKKIAIFGTLFKAEQIIKKLEIELNIPINYLIDNFKNTKIDGFEHLSVYNQEMLKECLVDVVIITIESPSRHKIAEELKANYPQIEVLTLEDIFE